MKGGAKDLSPTNTDFFSITGMYVMQGMLQGVIMGVLFIVLQNKYNLNREKIKSYLIVICVWQGFKFLIFGLTYLLN